MAREHLVRWWRHEGVVVGGFCPVAAAPHDPAPLPDMPASVRQRYEDVEWRARYQRAQIARSSYPADLIPVTDSNIGPGSLALALGSEPGFAEDTVWFEPAFSNVADVNTLPPLRFNPDAYWWQVHEAQLRRNMEIANGAYMVGFPDLVENIDILSALRDPQTLMFDMLESPEWVERSVWQINEAFFEGYTRLYNVIRAPDGSSMWGSFHLWGPGKTAKVQCDACAMFSPEMFRDFVKPALAAQCDWLDYSMYHLDGTQCVVHLDHLLAIPSLQAIQWTPQSGLEPGTHERWFPLYKRIIDAGKSVMIFHARADNIEPVLKALGGNGIYFLGDYNTVAEAEVAARIADRWR